MAFMCAAVNHAAEPCVVVIFGASGDLTHRKLIPALYELSHEGGSHGHLPSPFAVLGVSRTPMSDEQFREKMRESAKQFASSFDQQSWERFASSLHYHAGDAGKAELYPGLSERLAAMGAELKINKANGLPNLL